MVQTANPHRKPVLLVGSGLFLLGLLARIYARSLTKQSLGPGATTSSEWREQIVVDISFVLMLLGGAILLLLVHHLLRSDD